MVRVPGSWKSLDDLEENVTLDELERMLTAAREIEHNQRKFMAAMQGHNLDESSGAKSKFEEIQAEVLAINQEESEEDNLRAMGFSVERE